MYEKLMIDLLVGFSHLDDTVQGKDEPEVRRAENVDLLVGTGDRCHASVNAVYHQPVSRFHVEEDFVLKEPGQ